VDAQGELTYESKPVAIQNPDAAYTEVFETLIRESGVFPKGARLLGATIRGGTLQLNFSPDGKPIESLGGHIDLSHALPVSR
jgi:hypothetical protein